MKTDYDIKVIYDMAALKRLGKIHVEVANHEVNRNIVIGQFKPDELNQKEKNYLLLIDKEFDEMLERI